MTTAEIAAEQADALLGLMGEYRTPAALCRVIYFTLLNPLAGSDTLLILADAIREATWSNVPGLASTALADRLAEMARGRA